MLNEYRTELSTRLLAGDKLTIERILSGVDNLDDDLGIIQDFAKSHNICTDHEWRKGLAVEIRKRKLATALGGVPESALHFIQLYAAKQAVTVKHDGEVAMINPHDGTQIVTDASHFSRLYRIAAETHDMRYSAHSMADAADEFFHSAKAARRKEIMGGVAYRHSAQFGWGAIAAASCDADPAFAAALMKHFVWQVKRKNAGLNVDNHLMLIFGGAQNVGKSTFAKMLFSPVAELFRSASFSAITDEKIIELWDAPVIFMDEMAFATKADADEVKNVITATSLDRRPMRSNGLVKVRQKATLIGTTNSVLGQIIRDTTGVRRFAYLPFLTRPDYAAINAADWSAAWQTIDENAASPILEFLPMLREQQEQSRQQSSVEQWVASIDALEGTKLSEAASNGAIRREHIFDSYKEWIETAGIHQRDKLDLQSFSNELKRLEQASENSIFRSKRTRGFNGWSFHGEVSQPFLRVAK